VIIAIDPGSEQSAYVRYRKGYVYLAAKFPNDEVLKLLKEDSSDLGGATLAIEMVASYGRPVGAEVFATCVWIGRFSEAWMHQGRDQPVLVKRLEVRKHMCKTGNPAQAKDPHVRQALIDRFGPGKAKAVGTKKEPGPLYGVKVDMWQALAVAVTCEDRLQYEEDERLIRPPAISLADLAAGGVP
jgi:hypothetical protein